MIVNIEASIRAKLLNIAKNNKVTFDYIILRYMQEKLINRLVLSKYKNNFILKGGLFFLIFDKLNPRVTKDIDFLAKNIKNTPEDIKTIFIEILEKKLQDGLKYNLENIKSQKIKEDADYEGVRLSINCNLGKINKILQVDIGFGDKIYPIVQYLDYPSLLENNINGVSTYPIETVISEKFEAMLKLSYINSRMKDFYDIYNIISNYDIEGEKVKTAIKKTLKQRGTELNKEIVIFNKDFIEMKENQWKNYIKKLKEEDLLFKKVISRIQVFLEEIILKIKKNEELNTIWKSKTQSWE